MPSFQFFRRTLPVESFDRLRELLLQQAAKSSGEGAVAIAENILGPVGLAPEPQAERFALVVSGRFSGLVRGKPRTPAQQGGWLMANEALYEVELTFDREEIASFLSQLASFPHSSPTATSLVEQAEGILSASDGRMPSELALQLLEILAPCEPEFPAAELVYPYVSVCQPVEDALRLQIEQERLLNQVTSQIRQSLELPVILSTAVDRVQRLLQVDRLAIYQFYVLPAEEETQGSRSGVAVERERVKNPSAVSPLRPEPAQSGAFSAERNWGRITYEARSSDAISTVVNWTEGERCFVSALNLRKKYRKGFTQAIEDTEIAYGFSPCFLDLMRRARVRAKLVAPIVVGDELWGLLIAQQCEEPRRWSESEKNFLKEIAEHLAVAIHQAQLYAELQEQKQTLEQRVVERTQALQDALIAAQAASRAKSEFLSTMSHELRTPLTCVIGMSATLLRWSLGQLNQKQRNYLQTIHDSGEHLLELINDILDLSQVEAGKTVLNVSEFSLRQLAGQSLQELQDKARAGGVELEMDLKVDPPRDRFAADYRRIKQIVYNLLSNAVKFTHAGGQVTLRVWVEGRAALFQVEDTGIGIPENQLPLLFEKFQQLDSSHHRKYGGTGLGLALTKQLVELHGGWIEVESSVGEGSTFTVWLPAQPLSPAVPALAAEAPSLSSARLQGGIVLIEDDEEMATMICDILTAAGYQVVWQIEGSTAIEQIELLQPKAVIVDMELPGMDGSEIISDLRQSPAGQELKVLGLTVKMPHEVEAGGQGADDFLLKPVEPAFLLQKITQLTAAGSDQPAGVSSAARRAGWEI
ncbi:hybrid sensor histidine kinase/response regulator [Kamptonema formosum]|uniref:hybrid sensor histidine kinase/response regulator n=1 Tax=Kamptonema formosum TaxID=331992 RepID=UPI000475A436|nr:GAF domain-containing hybrid sensor histidine kinase/response regulator [Oscillatoria sp. PCC 10802]